MQKLILYLIPALRALAILHFTGGILGVVVYSNILFSFLFAIGAGYAGWHYYFKNHLHEHGF